MFVVSKCSTSLPKAWRIHALAQVLHKFNTPACNTLNLMNPNSIAPATTLFCKLIKVWTTSVLTYESYRAVIMVIKSKLHDNALRNTHKRSEPHPSSHTPSHLLKGKSMYLNDRSLVAL